MPASAPPPSPSAQQPLRARLARIWVYFQQWRLGWLIVVLGTVTAALTEASVPALLKPLLDEGFAGGRLSPWVVPIVIIALFALRGVAHFASQYALVRIANDGMKTLRRQLFGRLLHAELGLFSSQSASQLANTIVYEVQTGATTLVYAFLHVVRESLAMLALTGYLLYLNWQLTLIVFALAPVVAFIMRTMSKRTYRYTRHSQTSTDQLAYVVEENVLAHRMVRLYGAENQQAARFERISHELRGVSIKAAAAAAAAMPLAQMAAAVALSLVIGIALHQSATGRGVTVGSFVAFVSALVMLVQPLRRLTDVVGSLTRGLAALERGLDMMAQVQPEEEENAAAAPELPERATGEIAFENVSVHWGEEGAPPALDGVSLQLRAGETVALAGPSGAGKSTLLNLLPRFVLPTGGRVLLDGIPLQNWPLARLRAQFALVSQDVVMLNDTVAANVALGASDIDRERVQQCLRDANLAEHIATLPQGMDTVLGHNAAQLSGGQRQRLAIARALYKDAPVLLLDEATSALDTESERLVQRAIEHAMRGRTTLLIAHRLSTIEHADRICVMERGRIVEQGTHAALLAAGGLYARLHQHGGEASLQ
ncbi:MAG: lipid A export permease/ATP-binding protein MsbA [Ottowia sp.]|nr:lipid A export permease/ATP-binding protein MsbA [Ottowia sp.]